MSPVACDEPRRIIHTNKPTRIRIGSISGRMLSRKTFGWSLVYSSVTFCSSSSSRVLSARLSLGPSAVKVSVPSTVPR